MVTGGGNQELRLEEITKEQEGLQELDIQVPVVHCNKEIFSTFGRPFLVMPMQGDNNAGSRRECKTDLG